MSDLTPKQLLFAGEYLVDLNAGKAAIRAGYAEAGSRKTGFENLQNEKIQDLIAQAMEKRAKRTHVSQDRVICELARIAFCDPSKVMKWGPAGVKLIESSELAEDDVASVAEVSQTETQYGGSLRVKQHDKVKALELLGKHLGLFKEIHEHSGLNGLPIQVASVNADVSDAEAMAAYLEMLSTKAKDD